MTDDINDKHYNDLRNLNENSWTLGMKDSNMVIRAILSQTRILDNTQRVTQSEITEQLRDIKTQIEELRQMVLERSKAQ
ncbi:hypothetical protein WL26_03910 [Burkholderia cepacia]|uniref:hypothetical protein n=1 Tax=Burkholderia cepacia TaxID=292 RepID=UPI0007582CDD|nr:hypothetical protein [Burkholderia cepacia]KWA17374.1 hypothetical protein WL26_03910 [Burkholderia cepacia]